MEQSGNIPIFNIPGTLFRNIPENFIWNIFRNIVEIFHGNVPQIFRKHTFARWVCWYRIHESPAYKSSVDVPASGILLI